MARMVGIDLGSHAIKAVLFEGSLGRFQWQETRTRPVPQDVDQPPSLELRLATMRELLDNLGDDHLRPVVTMGFPAEDASVRMVRLPFGDRAQVERTLPFEVEGLVPFDLEEVVLTSRVLSLGAGESRVLAVLASKEALSGLLEALEARGVDPKHLVLDADLLGRFATTGVQAIVDIGHTRTLVTLCQDGKVVGVRALAGGGRDLTHALATAYNISWEEAEARKRATDLVPSHIAVAWDDDEDTNPALPSPVGAVPNLATEPPIAPGPARVLGEALRPLLADIRATLIGFEDTYGLGVDELRICGGTANLGGLLDMMRGELGVPVEPVSVPDCAESLGLAGALAGCLGLRATVGARATEVELRVGDYAYKGDLAAVGAWVAYAAVALLAFLIAGIGLFGYRSWQLGHQRSVAEAGILKAVADTWPDVDAAKLKDASTAIAIMKQKSDDEQARVDALRGIISSVPPTLNLLRDLSEGMPAAAEAKVDVTELSILDNTITMKIDTDGFESATKIQDALKTHPAFHDATGGDSKKVGDIVRFTVTIPLGQADTGKDASGKDASGKDASGKDASGKDATTGSEG